MFTPRVVDISHWTQVNNLQKTKDAGIWGIICKASQGVHSPDDSYVRNRQACKEVGMLWGAYHFPTGDDPQTQLNYFLQHAQADKQTLMALDYEENPSGSSMSIQQMVTFLRLAEGILKRKLVIYSGNFLKERIEDLSDDDAAYVCEHKLWLAHYTTGTPTVPYGFKNYWLWQYTGDGLGGMPHSVPGLGGEAGGLDLNVYAGTQDQLTSEWAT